MADDLSSRIRKARDAGFADDAILTELSSQNPDLAPRIKAALDAGHDPMHIVDFYAMPPETPQQPGIMQRAVGAYRDRPVAPTVAGDWPELITQGRISDLWSPTPVSREGAPQFRQQLADMVEGVRTYPMQAGSALTEMGKAGWRGDPLGLLHQSMGLIPFFGPQLQQANQEIAEKKYPEAFGHLANTGTQIAFLKAPEAIPQVSRMAQTIAESRPGAAVRGGIRGGFQVLPQIPWEMTKGGTMGFLGGFGLGEIPGLSEIPGFQYITGPRGAVAGAAYAAQKRLRQGMKQGAENALKEWEIAQKAKKPTMADYEAAENAYAQGTGRSGQPGPGPAPATTPPPAPVYRPYRGTEEMDYGGTEPAPVPPKKSGKPKPLTKTEKAAQERLLDPYTFGTGRAGQPGVPSLLQPPLVEEPIQLGRGAGLGEFGEGPINYQVKQPTVAPATIEQLTGRAPYQPPVPALPQPPPVMGPIQLGRGAGLGEFGEAPINYQAVSPTTKAATIEQLTGQPPYQPPFRPPVPSLTPPSVIDKARTGVGARGLMDFEVTPGGAKGTGTSTGGMGVPQGPILTKEMQDYITKQKAAEYQAAQEGATITKVGKGERVAGEKETIVPENPYLHVNAQFHKRLREWDIPSLKLKSGESPHSPAGVRTKKHSDMFAQDIYGKNWDQLSLEQRSKMLKFLEDHKRPPTAADADPKVGIYEP